MLRETRLDPAWWMRNDVLPALSIRDIATVYRLLQRRGVSQRRIAAMTGQSQSEVSEILAGRRVVAYDVLIRIADGLGVPRGLLGLAHDGVAQARPESARPVLDPESGRWVVRVPVFADSYGAALGLCDSAGAATHVGETADVPGKLDELAAKRWRLTAEAILGARVLGLRRAS